MNRLLQFEEIKKLKEISMLLDEIMNTCADMDCKASYIIRHYASAAQRHSLLALHRLVDEQLKIFGAL